MNASQRKYRIIENYSLLCADISSVLVSYVIAYMLRNWQMNAVDLDVAYRVFFITLCISIVYYAITKGGYQFFSRGFIEELFDTAKRSFALFVLVGFFIYALRYEKGFSRLMLGYFVISNFILTYLARCIIKKLTLISFEQGKKGDQILLITSVEKVDEVFEIIKKDDNWSYKISSIALMDGKGDENEIDGIPVVANKDNLSEVLKRQVFDVAFIYYPGIEGDELGSIVESIQLTGAMCHYAAELPARNLFHVSTGKFASLPVITYTSVEYDYRMRVVKRIMDLIGSIIGLLITVIITPFIAIAIKIDSPGPVFFSQTRLSKNGRQFKIYKFRTMYADAEERKQELLEKNEMTGNIFKIENDPRVTRVGKFLRKTSLDEFPQFWNVLVADMSLVGTRPPTVSEYEEYTESQKRRLSIRPGLTGLWQVSGRCNITDFDEIVKLDLEYIDNWSLIFDLKILVKTFFVVIHAYGAE